MVWVDNASNELSLLSSRDGLDQAAGVCSLIGEVLDSGRGMHSLRHTPSSNTSNTSTQVLKVERLLSLELRDVPPKSLYRN
jgi:hypothetical protein